ncbi:hypothetical protein STXM2123_3840 [Streptomyces sp. F-3]|nr:hypothetical protein STXM2123_3840 [Streptomyces sp. F-3]
MRYPADVRPFRARFSCSTTRRRRATRREAVRTGRLRVRGRADPGQTRPHAHRIQRGDGQGGGTRAHGEASRGGAHAAGGGRTRRRVRGSARAGVRATGGAAGRQRRQRR